MGSAKYIVIKDEGQELLFTFPETVMHLHMLEAIRAVK